MGSVAIDPWHEEHDRGRRLAGEVLVTGGSGYAGLPERRFSCVSLDQTGQNWR